MAPRLAIAAAVLFGRAEGLSRGLRSKTRGDDDCECLNWRNVYMRQAVQCGQGFEYQFSWETDIPWWAHEFAHRKDACLEFFEKIDDNICMNTHQDHHPLARKPREIDGQWCYVPKDCPQGLPTNGTSQVAYKMCGSEDTWSRNMTPDTLLQWSNENNLDLAFTLKMTYPVMNAVAWDFAQNRWGLQGGKEPAKNATVNDEIIDKLVGRIKKHGSLMVMNSVDSQPPFGMVQGEKAWLIKPKPREMRRRNTEELPSSRFEMECVTGCEAA